MPAIGAVGAPNVTVNAQRRDRSPLTVLSETYNMVERRKTEKRSVQANVEANNGFDGAVMKRSVVIDQKKGLTPEDKAALSRGGILV